MTQTTYTIDSANDIGQIDIFVDDFVSSFAYSAGEVTLSEITEGADFTRDQLYFDVEKIREWLDLLKANMPAYAHPQSAYSFEIEHGGGKVTFKFTHEAEVVLVLEYTVATKIGIISPRIGQTLSLRAFSRYVEALRLLIDNIRLYKD